ncbi:dolichyl-phosphate beta-D-mannosyltransferase [Actinomyces trachealis]|uniref:dolichyl-phosphate beta-D-mannosyltransferase n=1 Tax=Actinomyces trachealis TaxID=2763540 RepID=UPI0018929CFA|nr:dolichyl-phosphate beta-D-mannosyltransferase [Actinomyces trachealis]
MSVNSSKRREPTEAEIGLFLPRDTKAFRVEAISWMFWLLLAALGRTMLATHHVIYPRALTIGLIMALLILGTACLVTVHFWPWASKNVQRFADVGSVGYVLAILGLEFGAGITLVPWTAAAAGTAVTAVMQRWHRARWLRLAKSRWAREMGHL